MTGEVVRDGFRLRRATQDDAHFLAELAVNDEISPYLAVVSARDPEAFLEEIERAAEAPHERGRYVIEVADGEMPEPVGAVAFSLQNRRSRIANLYGLMLRPDARGRGLARAATRAFARHLLDDLGFHRIELECYGYNERALHHFERSGFVREGVKRRAYWRDGRWVDGVCFGLVREDVDAGALDDDA